MVELQQQHRQARLANAAADSLRHFAAQQRLVPLQLQAIFVASASWRFSAAASTRIPIDEILERIFQHRVPHRISPFSPAKPSETPVLQSS